MTAASSNQDEPLGSDIKDFYAGKSVFITGATGFIGKVLLIKLILSCPDIANIYILLRPKDNQTAEDRLNEMLSKQPFTFILPEGSGGDFKRKVRAVEGNITLPGLGISAEDRRQLTDNIGVVFHCAASIKFDAPLKDSLDSNVLATKSVIELCKEMKGLASFVHVSTAYSNCQLKEIDEKLYIDDSHIPTDPNGILRIAEWVSPDQLNSVAHHLLGGRPNNYTFTKALAEKFVAQQTTTFPIAIARPAIVFNAEKEPIPGWVDNINGPSGISVLGALGVLRCINWNYHAVGDFVPVDKVVNALIAIGWNAAVNQSVDNNNQLTVYNIVSSPVNPTTWGNLFEHGYDAAVEWPSLRVVRPIIKPPKYRREHPILYPLTKFVSHILFAYFVDLILVLFGKRSIMIRLTRKMHYAFDVMGYFTRHEWVFHSNNLVRLFESLNKNDKEVFDFDMSTIDWKTLAHNCHLGNRRHLLKEPDDNIPMAKRRLQKIVIGYWIFRAVLFGLIAYLFISLTPFAAILTQVSKFICFLVSNACPSSYCQSNTAVSTPVQ